MCSMSDLMQYHSLSSKDTVFWKFLYNQVLKVKFCSTQKIGWDFSLAHYEGDKILLNWYRLWNMSCLLRLPTTLPPNFKALFSSRNRFYALNDATVLLASHCQVGQKNANRLHVHWSACTLVAATQEVACWSCPSPHQHHPHSTISRLQHY